MMQISFKNYSVKPAPKPIWPRDAEAPTDRYEVLYWYEEEHCLVIGYIYYNKKEPCWEFESCGTRFLEYYSEGLSEYLMSFIKMLDVKKEFEEKGED